MNRNSYIWITGASSGIGRETAIAFAKKGYPLAICARRKEKLETLKEEIEEKYHTECLVFAGDVSKEDFVNQVAGEIARRGQIEALVNNAGISKVGLLQDLSLMEWNELMQINLTSMFLTCKAVIPHFLKQQKGSIVNVSSVWGIVGASCEVAYSASKGAVNAFSKALARELAPSGIRVNAAAFGAIDTKMNHHLDEDEKEALLSEIGMGRMGTAKEAAELLADLALNHMYLTGQVVAMDGSWVI